MKKQLLIIDNYDSFTYNLIQMIEEIGVSYIVERNDKIKLETVSLFKKILITPGPGLPCESGKIIPIIKKYSGTKSILGICLGCEAIAEAFGGKLVCLQRVAHGISKKIKILNRGDYIFKDLPEKIRVGLYHSWGVSDKKLPPSLEVTAISDDGIVMAISHKEFDVIGLQFHPESIMTDCGQRILSNWIKK